MEMNNKSSADDIEITKTSKRSHRTMSKLQRDRLQRNRLGKLTSTTSDSEIMTEDDMRDLGISEKRPKRKSNLPSVPEDVTEKQASEFGKGGFGLRLDDNAREASKAWTSCYGYRKRG